MRLQSVQAKYGTLEAYIRQAPAQDGSVAETVRDCGEDALNGAIKAVFNPNRTEEQSDAAVANLRDLERAMMAAVDQNRQGQAANDRNMEQLAGDTSQNGLSNGTLHRAGSETLSNTVQSTFPGYTPSVRQDTGQWDNPRYYWTPGTVSIGQGQRSLSDERVAGINRPAVDAMAGNLKFIKDLHGLTGFLAGVLAIPGPVPLAAGTFATEQGAAVATQNGSTVVDNQTSQTRRGFFGPHTRSQTDDTQTVTSGQQTLEYRIQDSDERVDSVAMVNDLISRLNQVSVAPASQASLRVQRTVQEFNGSRNTPLTWNIDGMGRTLEYSADKHAFNYAGCKRMDNSVTTTPIVYRSLEAHEFQPAHINLPTSGLANY